MLSDNAALILFSGGQDSATCLAWALQRYDRVETVGFDYGQRHAVEMSCRLKLRELMPCLKRNGHPASDRSCAGPQDTGCAFRDGPDAGGRDQDDAIRTAQHICPGP